MDQKSGEGFLLAYLLPWSDHLMCSLGMPAGVREWDNGIMGSLGEDSLEKIIFVEQFG